MVAHARTSVERAMSMTGATGPAPTAGVGATKPAELHNSLEAPAKTPAGHTPLFSGEMIDTGIVASAMPKPPQVESIKAEMPLSERSSAPKVVLPPSNVVSAAIPTEQPTKQQVPNATQTSGLVRDTPGKPSPIPPKFANFPDDLNSLPNWVLWRYLPPKSDGGKWRKVPFQPNGKTASTTDQSTWSRLRCVVRPMLGVVSME